MPADIRKWYDGYLFGDSEVYNPWSVSNFIKDAETDSRIFPRPYWSNTSSNSIIRELIEQADHKAKPGLEGYKMDSNREHGNGRPDILLSPYDPKGTVVILELNWAKKFAQMEMLCDAALKQIEDRRYETEFLEEGYCRIRKYGVCFCRKSCKVKTTYYEKPENT